MLARALLYFYVLFLSLRLLLEKPTQLAIAY